MSRTSFELKRKLGVLAFASIALFGVGLFGLVRVFLFPEPNDPFYYVLAVLIVIVFGIAINFLLMMRKRWQRLKELLG
jgi:putative flippase GtrA